MSVIAIPNDPELPGLSGLLNPQLMERYLRPVDGLAARQNSDSRVAYVRYTPSKSCLASYVLAGNESGKANRCLFGYGICLSSKAFADICSEVSAREWTKSTEGPPIAVLPDQQIIFFAFPNDRRLAGLQILGPEIDLRRFLSTDQPNELSLPNKSLTTNLVVYKPERRAVFCCKRACKPNDVVAYLKVYPDERATTVHATLTRLNQWQGFQGDFAIPRVLGFARDQHVLAISGLPGIKLESLIEDASAFVAFEATAHALASLHSHNDPEVPQSFLTDYLTAAQTSLISLGQARPDLKGEIKEVSALLHTRLPADESCTTGFLHGDLGLNVLVDSGRIGFIDFDRAQTGPIGADIGNLLSRLHHRACASSPQRLALNEVFMRAYSRAAKLTLAPHMISWWIALSLIQDTLRSVRRLGITGSDRTKELLEEVLGVLQRR